MSEIDRLIEEFAADYEAGRAVDPAALLERAGPGERQELAARLDSYLMTAPPRKWDPEAYEGSPAQRAVDRVYESLEEVNVTWQVLLPDLRKRAQIKRQVLVERLARALGFESGPEVAKVGGYYNRMEHGQLPASGVAAKVTDALATILDTGAERLRAAGARTDAAPGGSQAAFARTATPDAEFAKEPLLDADADEIAPAPAERDEIDALFLDG
jgi:hypothetical protein